MLKVQIAVGLALISLLASPTTVSAALLDGKTVEYQYLFPTDTTPYSPADNGNKIVGPGIEVSNITDNQGTLDISDTNLYVDFNNLSVFANGSFNGFRIKDILGTISPFTGVTINPATNMAGFSASRITFDSDQIWVNFESLNFSAETIVSLDIQSVPEPSTLLLATAGLLAFGWRRRAKNG